jgi:hypothetical protein
MSDCPSSQPNIADARIFGVVGGSIERPEVGYLDVVRPISDGLVNMPQHIKATEVFRIATHCIEKQCQHFDGKKCTLVERLVIALPAAAANLPACAIRPSCRWWAQEGKQACLRCPQVVTATLAPSSEIVEIARPPLK